MTSTLEARASRFRTISVVLGILVCLQALITLAVAFIDGAITLNPLILLAFLAPQVIQIFAGASVIFWVMRKSQRYAARSLLAGIIAADVVQGVGLSLVWLAYVPDSLDPQSVIASLVPLSEFLLVGTAWYGNVGYAILGITWGIAFWASIAFAVIALRYERNGLLAN